MHSAPAYRQIADVVGDFELACAQPEIGSALEYFDLHALEIWFGCPPGRLRETLGDLVARGAPANSVVRAVYSFLLGNPVELPLVSSRFLDEVLPEAEAFARMFEHRLRGQTVQASRAAADIVAVRTDLNAVFDRRGGWNLFLSVQLGTTEMLAGDLTQALIHFAEARMHPPAPLIRFLVREAAAKAALIEACEGDPEHARRHLAEARAIPVTTSWSEPGVDAILQLVESTLAEDPEQARSLVEAIPPGQIGELWPYAALALNRSLGWMAEYAEADIQLAALEAMALPRTPGVGYAGSILPQLRANNLLCLDNPQAAEALIESADPHMHRTQLLRAQLSLKLGQPRKALQQVLEISESERELRQVAVWRHALLAAAHLRLDQPSECMTVLERAMALPGRFRVEDALQFDDAVREFAQEMIDDWPRAEGRASSFARATAATGRHLTKRELAALKLLASGRSREEIAIELFISVNTLKTQLRSAYRKLGVSQRSAAILEAQRRGLI